ASLTAVSSAGSATTAAVVAMAGVPATSPGVSAAKGRSAPAGTIQASLPPTGMSSPTAGASGGIRKTPLSSASTSVTAFSVSTRNRNSPASTSSPSSFNHSTSRPTSIVQDRKSVV